MADPRFFKKPVSLSLADIARLSGAHIHGGADESYKIEDVAPLDTARAGQISFFENVKYRDQFKKTKAGAVIVHPDYVDDAPDGVYILTAPYPYKAYALTAQAFYPQEQKAAYSAPTAQIDKSAKIGQGAYIAHNVVIADGVQIGENVRIDANAVIGAGVKIGDSCWIGAHATISHAIIGHHVRLYPGVRVGQDGFGFAIDPAGHVKVPQLGRVIIEDHVEIGANTTIDRGAGPDTVIGRGSWIDNLVQIGHNVKIGKGCIIVAQTGIAGSTVLEDFVAIGGQVGIAGHLHIGQGARIAGHSGVMRDVPAGEEHMGYPAMPIKQFMRQIASLKRMIKK
jgi:UDP-3-O-[3-hydroxymyristoyl] glucosamine N-acyltransferase